MKKISTFFVLIAISLSIFAQTQVSGNQSGTWTLANSPYEVIGDITIPSSQVLTIEAGVEVNFQDYYTFIIEGNLVAIGTETDSIFFTTDNQTTGWGGIKVETSNPNDIITLSYCKIEYGKTLVTDEYPDMNGGAMKLLSSNAVCTNCVFAYNTSLPSEGMGGAIYAINTGSYSEALTKFTNCTFHDNQAYSEGGAIKFSSDLNTEITNCSFYNNVTNYGGGAIMFYSVIDTKITNCLFVGNITNYDSGGAFKTLGVGNTLFFENCTIVENQTMTGSGGAAALYYTTADFVNCIVYDNTSVYDDDNIYVDAGTSSATINYSDLIMPTYNTTGSNNINEDPLFIDDINGDFHLQATSPCIDTGTDIGLPFSGTAPDMGCYEYGILNAPYAVSYNPNPNEIDVNLTETVSVVFNEEITEIDLNLIDIKDENNVSVTGISAQIEDDNKTITISHDNFDEITTYTVTIAANTVQNTGATANEEIVWSFTTKIAGNIIENDERITIYPNPSNGIFNIQTSVNFSNIIIKDVTGRTIKKLTVSDSNYATINIENQASGIYFLEIQLENEIITKKIIIE